MNEATHTLAAILVHLDTREAEITTQATTAREAIEQLTARLTDLDQQLEHVRITRKTLTELPEPAPPGTPHRTQDPPEHPVYEQILTALAAAGRPMRAREVCDAIDMPTTATNINNVRSKLKRLTGRDLTIEVEQGLYTQVHA
jgi:hypothetical protein